MQRTAYFLILTLTMTSVLQGCRNGHTKENLYGTIPVAHYVTGRFKPYKKENFIRINDVGIPTNGRSHYLRKEAAQALLKMYRAFRKEHPKVPFYVCSSTRTFYDQKYIWERKWNRLRSYSSIKNRRRRARAILRYSSMPGTSRHHWGSDFDLNKLYNSYYKKGKGLILYRWLCKNAHRFGFCQPYTAGRDRGYNEERWHWSYLPLARHFLKDWNRLFKESNFFSRGGLFDGDRYGGYLAPVYVNSINPDCK